MKKKTIALRINVGNNLGALTHSSASKNNLRVELAFTIETFVESRISQERIYIVIEPAK